MCLYRETKIIEKTIRDCIRKYSICFIKIHAVASVHHRCAHPRHRYKRFCIVFTFEATRKREYVCYVVCAYTRVVWLPVLYCNARPLPVFKYNSLSIRSRSTTRQPNPNSSCIETCVRSTFKHQLRFGLRFQRVMHVSEWRVARSLVVGWPACHTQHTTLRILNEWLCVEC